MKKYHKFASVVLNYIPTDYLQAMMYDYRNKGYSNDAISWNFGCTMTTVKRMIGPDNVTFMTNGIKVKKYHNYSNDILNYLPDDFLAAMMLDYRKSRYCTNRFVSMVFQCSEATVKTLTEKAENNPWFIAEKYNKKF